MNIKLNIECDYCDRMAVLKIKTLDYGSFYTCEIHKDIKGGEVYEYVNLATGKKRGSGL